MTLGEKLTHLRMLEGHARGLGREMTQAEVARAVREEQSGQISQSYLSQLESGSRTHARRRHVLEIVDEMAGMDLEQTRQKQPGGPGHLRARAAFQLREIGLADLPLQFLAHGSRDFRLRHLPLQTAGVTFEHP